MKSRDHSGIDLSVVVPMLNEEKNLRELSARLKVELAKLGRNYEVIFVDDGSSDGTWRELTKAEREDPHMVAIRLNRNYGQHVAVIAGMEIALGNIVITIDADLQNPPEEIGKLVKKIDEGYDVVGGWRNERQDPLARKLFSFCMNRLVSVSIGVQMRDAGCMLRAYSKAVAQRIVASSERAGFIPALAALYGSRIAEVPIAHSARQKGSSKYNLFKLVRLNYDLLTGFSLMPIQVMTFLGGAIFVFGLVLFSYLIVRSFMIPSYSGLDAVYTMFALLYLLVGILVLAIGIVGEYIGRIYLEVRNRPRYIVAEQLGRKAL